MVTSRQCPPGIIPEPIPDAGLEPVPTVRKHPLPLSSFCGGNSCLCIMHVRLVCCASTPIGLCSSAASLDLGWGSRLGIFQCKRDGYLIFSESWLTLTTPFWVNLLLFYYTLLFHPCHCLLMEIISCWQAVS